MSVKKERGAEEEEVVAEEGKDIMIEKRPRIIDMERKPQKCPVCGERVVDIIYGTGDMTEIELTYGRPLSRLGHLNKFMALAALSVRK